ncbi:MAG: asparagine synthase (glutamine-hydrolyzing) [Bacteroidia bacterium]|nr:asparagine synthase (glutamine-hydrolyzing) [Bacteroidia bacterium]
MCGIAGYINLDRSKQVSENLLKKMTDCISHRGPDGEGFYTKDNIAFGHRRLSIIDLSTGDQPMHDENGNIIIFNGEIYNYIELREELKKIGYKFKTNSDTEVILKAYTHWGYECQNKFNGMWAFAIWDQKKSELFLSRDRIGEKPLHYAVHNNTLIFGSEIKSLFAFGVPRNIRPELIEIYLTLTNIPAPHTFYKDIFKLMPGHFLRLKDSNIEEKKYWDLPAIDEKKMLTDEKSINENFSYLLGDAIKLRMRSDVPFGAFLSGGLDSSSVVALMSEISDRPINTFTIGFEHKAFDESKLAKEVADKFKTIHHLGTVAPDDFKEILKKNSFHYDEPFGDSSAIPTGYVSRFASKKVKMVLTGDGGDEVLSGYTSYQGIKLSNAINKFPGFITKSIPIINDSIAPAFKGGIRYKLNKVSSIIKSAGQNFPERMAEKMAYTDFQTIKQLTRDIKDVIPVEDHLKEVMKGCSYKDDFYKLMFLNFKHDLPNDYLVKVDRMSMAYSLEARVPFLDHRLIEYMAKVDKNIKMQGWERKSVLRNTIGKNLPDSILNAPKKGFGIPLREWFKSDLFDDQLKNNLDKISEITSKPLVSEILKQNKLGEKDNGNFIWTLMMLNENLT